MWNRTLDASLYLRLSIKSLVIVASTRDPLSWVDFFQLLRCDSVTGCGRSLDFIEKYVLDHVLAVAEVSNAHNAAMDTVTAVQTNVFLDEAK
jgi:hypothetical protein